MTAALSSTAAGTNSRTEMSRLLVLGGGDAGVCMSAGWWWLWVEVVAGGVVVGM